MAWSKEQEEILIKNLKDSKTLEEAFKKTSKEIDKATKAISMYFYKNLSEITDYKKNKKVFDWNEKKINILLNNITKYPTNIKYALEITSKELNTGYHAVYYKWYGKLGYEHRALRKNKEVYQLTCGSKEGFSQNVKNNTRKRDEQGNFLPPEQVLFSYQTMIKQMLDLEPKERNKVINYFINNGSIVIKENKIVVNNKLK